MCSMFSKNFFFTIFQFDITKAFDKFKLKELSYVLTTKIVFLSLPKFIMSLYVFSYSKTLAYNKKTAVLG